MILRGRDGVEATTIEDIHGGEGKAHVRQLLGEEPRLPDVPGFPEDFDSTMNFFHETILEEGASIGLHPQEGNEEIYYFVEGEGDMTVDDKTEKVGPGDVCLTKDGSKHALKNTGDGELRILVIEADVLD
ncbi:MAG: cupin domain-containing protein [Candidatus Hadarchaeia archaeon]